MVFGLNFKEIQIQEKSKRDFLILQNLKSRPKKQQQQQQQQQMILQFCCINFKQQFGMNSVLILIFQKKFKVKKNKKHNKNHQNKNKNYFLFTIKNSNMKEKLFWFQKKV